jgi:hypothetical protein
MTDKHTKPEDAQVGGNQVISAAPSKRETVYEIAIDYQTPEDKKLVDGLVAYSLWGEEERKRKEPHAIHTLEYTVSKPLSANKLSELKAHMIKTYETGGYTIRGITFKRLEIL